MNKQKFIELIEHPESVRQKDAEILAELARNYPYSSLVHTLLAKALQKSEHAKSSLATAALYIPDRSVLKSVMENKEPKSFLAAPVSDTSIQVVNAGMAAKEEMAPAVEVAEEEMEVRRSVFDELQENLQKLREQRERFENQDKQDENTPLQNSLLQKKEETAEENTSEGPKTQVLPERLQELIDNKEEQEINDPKRKEQINLIDRFIQNSSSISRKYRSLNDHQEEQNDLTGNYHFTPPDLVTENLAKIMVRQGKPEKAIDIYEKLVLKYPQKKAYFASCIEKLKNA